MKSCELKAKIKNPYPVMDMAPDLRKDLPVIPLRDVVLFPGTITPLLLGRPDTISSMFQVLETPGQFAVFILQKNSEDETVTPDALHKTGVLGKISSYSQSSGNLSRILVESLFTVISKKIQKRTGCMVARVHRLHTKQPQKDTGEPDIIYSRFLEYLNQNPDLPTELAQVIDNRKSREEKVFAIASQLFTEARLKQLILEEPVLEKRESILGEILKNELDMNTLNRQLEHEVRTSISQTQKEYYLSEQLKKIQIELGKYSPLLNPEIKKLEKEVYSRNIPDKTREKILAEIRRLDILHTSSPEYAVVRNYIDLFLSLPWGKLTEDNLVLHKVKKQLDKDHHGLSEVKDRIIEHVAVYRLSGRKKSPVICFVGPPGVGKTSLGSSIAQALNRKFTRISLGGIRDEAEIRGHRRTYIGSMPGKIIQALKKCRSMNPVIMLDEVDKMGLDYRGDPSSALLEVLDPEQNFDFTDHFIEIGVDLSQVFFITTANVESSIPEPLRDRMEIIRISGYHLQEKLEITKRHLLPKIRSFCGLHTNQLDLNDGVLKTVIARYTHEAGVRNLEKAITRIARKRARKVVQSGKKLRILCLKDLPNYLGIPLKKEAFLPATHPPGIITGLAWTPAGGEVLQVECKLLSGKGRLQLTGKMGEIMRESAQIALTLVRERAQRFGIDPAVLRKTDIHLHLPEGSIPKDGPSAGVAMTLSLLSALIRQRVDPKLAFTGEISLTGKIHAVGGIPEKALAALQAGVTHIYSPKDNGHDISKLPVEAKKGLKIEKVEHIDAVIQNIFQKN